MQSAIGLGPWYVLVRMAVKAEVLLGLCAAITDSLGTATQPTVQLALADAMVYLETLRAFVQAAEAHPVRSASGLALPNPTTALAGRIFSIERYPHMLPIIRELCGSGILMAPGQADLHHPEIGPHLYRYVVGQDEGSSERFRLLKLAWEYACDSFGARQLLHERKLARTSAIKCSRVTSISLSQPGEPTAWRHAAITSSACWPATISHHCGICSGYVLSTWKMRVAFLPLP